MADEPPFVSIVARRRQRRRALVAGVVGVVVAAATVGLLLAVAARTDDGGITLGDDEFVVGRTEVLARRIDADRDTPLLFQDLVDGGRDIWVQHLDDDADEGWSAFAATAPGQPRRCQLRWRRDRFVDPCTNRTFPPDGDGLRQYRTTVRDGRVVVDLRDG